MNRYLYLFAIFVLYSCTNHGQLSLVTKLPKKLDENSGMVHLKNSTVWFIQDGGNSDKIYQMDFKGNLINELKVKNATNVDWEDLTTDPSGNMYIGDFGNNDGKRKDLVIYQVPNPETEKGDKIKAVPIRFKYPGENLVSKGNKQLQFDAEAMFFRDDFLYIITKNRKISSSGDAGIYRVPARKGTYTAELVGKFNFCALEETCRVTGATISPDGQMVVLLGRGKLWVFTDFKGANFTLGQMKTIDLKVTTQLEAICFLNDGILLLSDEKKGNTGRNLYRFHLRK